MSLHAFTAEANGRVNVLVSPCTIFPAFHPGDTGSEPPLGLYCQAIWDTGATNSVITDTIAKALGLSPYAFTTVNHGGGTSTHVPVYRINMGLPNNVRIVDIPVSEGQISGADVIIGMDIISQGDLAITNANGKTVFTFRMPSVEKIDFVAEMQKEKTPVVNPNKVGRNDLCPCGSGKKYKHCHGKK